MKKNIFKKTSFYVKTLFVYGGVLALLYCSNMIHDPQRELSESLQTAEYCSVANVGSKDGQYSSDRTKRLLSLFTQARCVEGEIGLLHRLGEDAEGYQKREEIRQNIKDLSKKLKEERTILLRYLSSSKTREIEKYKNIPRVCHKGLCRRPVVPNSKEPGHERMKQIGREYHRNLNKFILKFDITAENLGNAIRQFNLRQEAAEGMQRNKARIRSGDMEF